MNNNDFESIRPISNENCLQLAHLRHAHVSCDSLARYEREKDANCKHTSKPTVDWSLLLKLNPPPGYSPCKNRTGLSEITEKSKDDSVIRILRKILQELEQDIREEKRKLRESRRKERERRRKERLKAMTQTNPHVPVLSGAVPKNQQPDVKLRKLRRQMARNTEDAEVEDLMTRSLDRALPKVATSGLHDHKEGGCVRDSWGVGDRIKRMSADILGRRNKNARWREHIRPRSVEIPADRSLSNGTSGYSTEERSTEETSDSDDNRPSGLYTCGAHIYDKDIQRRLNRYFLVLPRGSNMALQVEESKLGDQEYTNSHSFMQNISMSDLALPDHMGWLTDQSEHRKVWGIVVDMLFCIFESKEAEKPEEVILLPGCSIRPLVYKTAINGLHSRKPARTITGVAKFQIVLDNSSTQKKHLFSFDTQNDLDVWYRVLKNASNLDPDSTNDIVSERRTSLRKDGSGSNTSLILENGSGYMPSQTSPNRVQKMSKETSEDSSGSEVKFDLRSDDDSVASVQNQVNGKSSPRTLIRNESRRQSVQDFRKRLRRETEPEVSKHLPLKAQHFPPAKHEESKAEPGKKIRSFGSIESLLKFKRKRKKKESEDSTSEETVSITSASSFEPELPRVSSSVDFSAKRSQMKNPRSRPLSRSLEFSKPEDRNSGLVRRASDIRDKFFQKRPTKRHTKLGDLTDVSIHGFLQHKHHLKWQKLWCVVCRGCFYGFRSQSPDDSAYLAVVLSNCVVIYMTDRDRRHKHQCVFKLSQENAKSIYLCASDIRELQQWLQVLQMEANNVQSNVSLKRQSSTSSSIDSSQDFKSPREIQEQSRSRSKKKRAPPKPPRHSSCPPPTTRDPLIPERGTDSSTDDTAGSSLNSSTLETGTVSSSDDGPTHDKAVAHVWQNDRGYLFNVIRAKLKAYKNKDQGTIYNRDLPGPGNEGLLLVDDVTLRKGSREVRRSQSFNARSKNMEERKSPDSPTNMRKRHKPLVVKKVPAKDLENNTIAGYLEKKCFNGQWVKYWYVLHEGTLFCYLTSDDNVTVDVLNLNGYSVTSMVDKFRGKRFVLQLSHENFTSLYLSMESREELEEWQECLSKALVRPAIVIREDAVSQELGACAGCENNRLEDVGEKAKKVKQKLLEEMLRQKHELEKKQAERQRRQKTKDPESPDRSPNSSFMTDFMTEDTQRTSDVTRLRQRRLSTQLKMDTIQKQMHLSSNPKRGLFGFGKQKKLDENKNIFLQGQLKELSDKLNRIDTDLSQVEQDKIIDTYDLNQNKQQRGGGLDSLDGENVDNSEVFDNDSHMGRGNSIKARMQKLTKSSVKYKKRSKSPHNSGSMPDLTSKQNGDIVNGHNYDADHDISTEDCLSSDSSVTDLTRPADLPLDLASSHNGSSSPTSLRYDRSNSRTSTLSNLSSPRREINPSVLAEIDAFEELSRQVLSARSKELPTK